MLPTVLHVRDLQPGAQLKISMKAGAAIEQDHSRFATSPRKGRRALGWSRCSFYAFLISNDPLNGKMIVSIDGMILAMQESFNGEIEYGKILYLQQVVPAGRPVVETAPVTHPGAKALGTRMAQLYQQPYLIPVTFVGR
jgi:hypothetical protein